MTEIDCKQVDHHNPFVKKKGILKKRDLSSGSSVGGPEYRHEANEDTADAGSSKIQTVV